MSSKLVADFKLALIFFRMLRDVRKRYPDKNLFQRIEFACDAFKHHNVKAQIFYAGKHGPI